MPVLLLDPCEHNSCQVEYSVAPCPAMLEHDTLEAEQAVTKPKEYTSLQS